MTFKVGDKVSWDVGTDVYTGEVVAASPTRVRVARPGQPRRYERLFTKRADGRFLLKGNDFGTLQLGGEEYRDPSF